MSQLIKIKSVTKRVHRVKKCKKEYKSLKKVQECSANLEWIKTRQEL